MNAKNIAEKILLAPNAMRLILHKSVYIYKAVSYISSLIEDNRIVILRAFFQMKGNETARMIAHDIVNEYFEHYPTLRIKKSTSDRYALPRNIVLIEIPLAMINIPSSYEEYLKTVGTKTRNMIRKAEKQGYEFREFDWNKHRHEIFDINTSKEVRSAGPMHGWYVKPVQARYHNEEEQHYWKYYGVFKNDRLWAYANLLLCGNFAFFKHFLGHADHMTYGIMNYLMSCTLRKLIAHPHIEWLNYGWMLSSQSSNESSIAFKKHAGFEAYATFFDLENELDLFKYSKKSMVYKIIELLLNIAS
jgi:hypothetical protein